MNQSSISQYASTFFNQLDSESKKNKKKEQRIRNNNSNNVSKRHSTVELRGCVPILLLGSNVLKEMSHSFVMLNKKKKKLYKMFQIEIEWQKAAGIHLKSVIMAGMNKFAKLVH